jgi:flagellar biosynthetic protein FliR
MSGLEAFLVSRFMVFTLVLARTGALVATAPIFGSQAVPRRVRALLAVTMSLLVTPVYLSTSIPPVDHLVEYGRLLVNEVLVGLMLGLGMNILFTGIQVAGQIVSQMSGLSLADVFNPAFDEDVSVFSQLFYFLTLAVFVAVGGHRIVTEALLATFTSCPPGHAALGETFADALVSILTQSFVLGIRAAAVGFGLNSLLALGMLFLSLGAVAWTFQEPTVDVMQQIGAELVGG